MSTAHLSLPGFFYAPRRLGLDLRAIVVLSVVIAVCCASMVFVVLCHSEQPYPVAAVHNRIAASAALPPSPASTQPGESPGVSTVSTISSTLRTTATAEPIARTHEELLALERMGDRNYVEFSIARTGSFQPVGPVQICFWRSDAKHGFVRVSIVQDKERLDFDRLDVNEPVRIGNAPSQRLEIVVNGLRKNQITGYLSEPKAVTRN